MRSAVQVAKLTYSAAPDNLLISVMVTRQTQVLITGKNMVSLPVGTRMNVGSLP
jgi:hypothetical protein